MTGTFERLLEHLARALEPLTSVGDADEAERLVNALGWELPAGADELGALVARVEAVVDRLRIVVEATPEEQEDDALVLERYADLLLAVGELLADLVVRAQALAADPGLPADYVTRTRIVELLPGRLVDLLVVSYLEREAPAAHALLLAAGLVEIEEVLADPAEYRTAHLRRSVRLDRLGALLSTERSLLGEVYGWGTPAMDHRLLLARLGHLLAFVGEGVRVQPVTQALEELLLGRPVPEALTDPLPQLLVSLYRELGLGAADVGVTVVPMRAGPAGTDAGIAVAPYAQGTATIGFPLTDDGRARLDVAATVDLTGGLVLSARPRQGFTVRVGFLQGAGNVTTVSGGVSAVLGWTSPAGRPTVLLQLPGGSRVEVGRLAVGGGVDVGPSGAIGGFVQVDVGDGRVVVSAAAFDSFLSTLLADDIEITLDLQIGWSSDRGLYFSGGAGLELTFAVDKTLGPFRLDDLLVGIALRPEGVAVELSASGGAAIGPVAASVERLGIAALVRFEPGNLGPAQLDLRFKPPTGLGLVVEAGPVTGGGFISFDPDNGRYAGVLQLRVQAIAITAIGLLDTRLPGGAPGFSFLVIITAEFTPIQLGFGFTLNGVGGLAGIHRGLAVEPLRAGIRAHTVDRILFPEDPVRDAPQLISDLRAIFPPAQGRYVFGPMAILGWGTPSVVTAQLGIVLELPNPFRIVLLGQLDASLPEAEDAIVELHLDVLGVLDFGAKTLSIDASLYDSRIAAFQVYGDMAMRLSWGAEPTFALAVGGFHPAFRPPPGFPELRRLTVALGDGENPRLTMQSYLAITSNSFQVGARAELYAEAGGFNVVGWLGFDALFVFSPFSFQTQISAGFALRRGQSVIASIHLEASLSGPSPFHVRGEASISILFFEITVTVEATFNEERRVEAGVGDPWSALAAAIADPASWSVTPAPEATRVVSLASTASDAALRLLDPLGGLTLREKVVPLDRTLTKFGENVLPTPQRFVVRHDQVRVGGRGVGAAVPVLDHFAPGQFEVLPDQARLSRPSFERMQGGIGIADDALAFTVGGGVRAVDAGYETTTIDAPAQPPTPVPGTYTMSAAQQLSVHRRSAAATGGTRAHGLDRFAPPHGTAALAALDAETFVVAAATDGALRTDVLAAPTTQGAAYQAVDAWLVDRPQDRTRLVVVPEHEREPVP